MAFFLIKAFTGAILTIYSTRINPTPSRNKIHDIILNIIYK
ncbi:MAG: hypothetical protein ACP5RI_03710 [Candidatus Micrarchaeia archaeon]